jgi:transposase
MSLTKSKLVSLYKKENDPKVKERLLLVIRVRENGQVPFRVVKEMHRSNPWASNWLKRYDEEGIEGLQDRTKSGIPPELTEEVSYQIKQELKESNQGWTTKQVEELIVKKSGTRYHYTHIYRILRKWGFKQKVPIKYMLILCISRREREIQKKTEQILVDKQQKQKQQESLTIVSTDDSFFFYDSLL